MHGCPASDVWWLARDFGIRACRVFDTQEFERYATGKKQPMSLTALWVKYCEGYYDLEILNNKDKYQKSNWAKRPIPDEMFRYAAHDSHFLLMISQRQIQSVMSKGESSNLDSTIIEEADFDSKKESFLPQQ